MDKAYFSENSESEIPEANKGKVSNIHRKLFLQALKSLQFGSLSLTWPNGQTTYHEGKSACVNAEMTVYHWGVIDRLITHGDVGLGEDYMADKWSTPDLLALMRLAAANLAVFDRYLQTNLWLKLLYWCKHHLFSNTLKRSRQNVHEHYDLGNDFYRLWLDKSMTYSSALFNGDASVPLIDAQKAKYQRILQRLAPAPGSHMLEIGCGWGGFMEVAAASDCHVMGVTLSNEQAQFAVERLYTAGLDANTEVRLQDYRELTGSFDYVVSIGMFEHVGESYWSTYMKDVHNYLRPAGKAMIQTITIAEERFEQYRAGSDFLREHIFPGGMLPSRERFEAIAVDSGLVLNDVFEFGLDYAITLEQWLANVDKHIPAIQALGYSEKFIRKWRFYLASCAGMFRAGGINVMQVELGRP
ncbi:MAG: class I SAM-dependent methyltransferase [Cycloclasticus sp.]|jgi:cyclopropane-fatty-acyl-phospholipid synthase|uniref:SAM-dependent methyltransferase n=1 Tax=Haliea salexigens TaxID=287487 RepID=UPI0004280171|nr:cyclopropane-fatty-acyl-phospholipid synthase family protein [Haliea salexigens]MAV30850.1 class I SAM-dependent methyltransferase [Cycloclasticus sp.]|tara:strand:- start:1118 stop:2356 length:1239 start_codon:yes stop_codon:yes gene_type:complete